MSNLVTVPTATIVRPREPSIYDLLPGLHPGVSAETYHKRLPGMLSKGALDLVAQSPLHYKHWLDTPPEEDEDETAALFFGKAFHCALLEPEEFEEIYAVEPVFGDCRLKENKAARDKWRAAHAFHTPISAVLYDKIVGMVAALRAHPLTRNVFDGEGEPELTIRWKDETTGLPCKARADLYKPRLRAAFDVKTAANASYGAFRRAAADYRYHCQDAFYRTGFAEVGHPIDSFVFVAIEKTPPYAIASFVLDDDDIARGRARVRADIATFDECLRTDSWPGYPVEIQTLKLPSWAA